MLKKLHRNMFHYQRNKEAKLN